MNTQGSDTGVRRTEVANEEMVGITKWYVAIWMNMQDHCLQHLGLKRKKGMRECEWSTVACGTRNSETLLKPSDMCAPLQTMLCLFVEMVNVLHFMLMACLLWWGVLQRWHIWRRKLLVASRPRIWAKSITSADLKSLGTDRPVPSHWHRVTILGLFSNNLDLKMLIPPLHQWLWMCNWRNSRLQLSTFTNINRCWDCLCMPQLAPVPISFAVNTLAQHALAPGEPHLQVLKFVFHYLTRTWEYCLIFNGRIKDSSLVSYVDADWASNPNSRHSISGYAFLLSGCILGCQETTLYQPLFNWKWIHGHDPGNSQSCFPPTVPRWIRFSSSWSHPYFRWQSIGNHPHL